MKDYTKCDCIIIFTGKCALRFLRVLRLGYRHCCIIIKLGNDNILIDTMSHKTSISVIDGKLLQLFIQLYMDEGYTVLETSMREPKALVCTLRPHTCVEAAKRIIGIQDGRILSPWQLYLWVRAYKNRKQVLYADARCAIHN